MAANLNIELGIESLWYFFDLSKSMSSFRIQNWKFHVYDTILIMFYLLGLI